MVVALSQSLLAGGTLESASPAEETFIPDAINFAGEHLGRWPCRLIAGKAYDTDWLRHMLRIVGGELICIDPRECNKHSQRYERKL